MRAGRLKAASRSCIKMLLMGITLLFVTLPFIQPVDAYAENTILLTGGTLSGQPLSYTAWTVSVKPGEPITGSIYCETYNGYDADAVVPFGYTWTWARRENAIVTVDGNIPRGTTRWDVPIDIRAPDDPGTYYILFGSNGEFNMSQVLSSTSWVYDDIVWNDGNDFHDMGETSLLYAHGHGFVPDWPYLNDTGYHNAPVPVMPIRVVVGTGASTEPSPVVTPEPSGPGTPIDTSGITLFFFVALTIAGSFLAVYLIIITAKEILTNTYGISAFLSNQWVVALIAGIISNVIAYFIIEKFIK